MTDSKTYKKELNRDFNDYCVKNNISHAAGENEKYWELYETMVEEPSEVFRAKEMEEWENSEEKQDFLKNEKAKRLAMYIA